MSKQTLEQKFEAMTPARLFKWLAWILAIASVVVACVFIAYFSKFHGSLSIANADWGTFGDFVGGTLNPILSFLGLIALLLTIVLQSKELESTRKELERSASAQENTERVLKEQTTTQIKQQFEGTFFSLLEQHNKLLEKLSMPNARWTGLCSDLEVTRTGVFSETIPDLVSAKKKLESNNELFGHYFRVLYQLLKFIATNCPGGDIGPEFNANKIQNKLLSDEEKMYSNIVRSFLGYDITQLLAINCFCVDENDSYWKYKLLIERYEFLEHMPFEINGKIHALLSDAKNSYKNKAFGRSDFMQLPAKA